MQVAELVVCRVGMSNFGPLRPNSALDASQWTGLRDPRLKFSLRIRAMRRLFLIFLLLMVQFQFVWGAAAAYCGHETSAVRAAHFGHHEHRHQGDESRAPTSEKDSNGQGLAHADCGSCHFGTLGALPAPGVVMAELSLSEYLAELGPRFSSHVPSAPERPDRIALVAAA